MSKREELIEKLKTRDISLKIRPEFLDHLRKVEQKGWWVNRDGDHYSLLCWLSEFFENETIYDVGTFLGMSALALAANPTNKVITYDVQDWPNDKIMDPPSNIEFVIGNFFDDPNILKSPLIMFDVDPHDGIIEKRFLDWLENNNYKGLVFLDDIRLNQPMHSVWRSIKREKYDLTDFGHFHGSGLVVYN